MFFFIKNKKTPTINNSTTNKVKIKNKDLSFIINSIKLIIPKFKAIPKVNTKRLLDN